MQQPVPHRLPYYTVQPLAAITTVETAEWLIEAGATEIIQNLASFVGGAVREALRPHSQGVIDAQDENARGYAVEKEATQRQKRSRIQTLQQRLLTRTTLPETLSDLHQLTEEHWPELPEAFRNWLSGEISTQLASLDLEHAIRWEGNTLWRPGVLPLLLRIVSRYELPVVPDELMLFPATGKDEQLAAKYYSASDSAIEPRGPLSACWRRRRLPTPWKVSCGSSAIRGSLPRRPRKACEG